MKSAIALSKCAPPAPATLGLLLRWDTAVRSEGRGKESYKDAQIGSMLHGRPIKRSLTRLFTTGTELEMALRVPHFLEYAML